MDLGEQPDMNPNQSFRGDASSQFQSQYPYPSGTSAFAMDQEMNLGTDNFATSVQAHANAALENNNASNNGRPGQSQDATGVTGLGASSTGIPPPGMAPPQGAGNSYSPGGARPSIDDTQDGAMSGGDPKRKRSKVSRACDECRRKKVRCDAAADDGTIKTCSNCARAGLTCEYSRVPMKRGPSKGYIKELSERVQQVESLQMALSNTPGYRQSLDATGGVYADQPYSPDDPMSLKRNFSFSTDPRSPFVGPEYHRDRMPSLGGWTSSPHSAIFRTRDRGSIAIAPDQHPSNPISYSKPFWAQNSEEHPSKRQKMDVDEISRPELGQEFLDTYYRQYHANLPILPDADAAIATVGKATLKVQHAFITVIQRLPIPRVKATNGETSQNGLALTLASDVFKSYQELEEFMWNAARESPTSRSAEDNLLLIWTYLLMAIEAENDLGRLHDGPLPRTVLIKQAVDLGWSCVTSAAQKRRSDPNLTPQELYLNDFARAWHCATVPARLHALAVGSGNPIPRYHHQYSQMRVPSIHEALPPTGIIVALSAGQLTVVSCVVQDNLPPSQWGRHMDIHHRMTIQEGFDNNVGNKALASANETMVDNLRFFIDLTLSRYTENFHPMDIIIPAAALAEALRKQLAASNETYVYNPYHLHFFTLTTITLLEFLSEEQDTEMYKIASNGVEDIKVALEQISERDHIADEQQDQPAPQTDNSEDDNAQTVRKPVHWADVLLKMVEERVKDIAATNAANANTSSGGGSKLGDGVNAAVDFSLLLRHGYLTVLSQQLGQWLSLDAQSK